MTKTAGSTDRDEAQLVAAERKGISRGTFVGALVAVALIGFGLGTRATELADFLPFIQMRNAPSSLDLASVQHTYRALRQNFDGKLDTKKLIEGANRGMVEAAGDPYTTYFTKKEANEFMNDLEGTFSGIGAELGMKEEKLVVVTTLDDSPAKKAGLKKDDVIAKVNDLSLIHI